MNHFPAVKICGLRHPETAVACAAAGADAVGLVFYPPSPRHIRVETARDVVRALPASIVPVGVFVDPRIDDVRRCRDACGLNVVQLHGHESPRTVTDLTGDGFHVIKTLRSPCAVWLETIARYPDAASWLVECGHGGALPGGNGIAWDWRPARMLGGRVAFALAGGLSAGNVARAIAEARPDAVDVSSAVESSPGTKDLNRIRAFLAAVRSAPLPAPPKNVFIRTA